MSSIIERFLSGSYKVRRSCAGKYVNGYWVAGDYEDISVRGSMQPVNARELKLPEEGGRLKQYWKFYTDIPVLTIDTRNLKSADIIWVNGDRYKVMSVESWQGFSLSYHMATIYREPEQ